MRITAFSTLALGIGLVSVQLSACGNSADDCTATATCGAAAGSSSAGTAGKTGGSGSGNDAGGPSGGSVSTGGSASTGGSSSMSGTTGTGGEGGSGTQACTGDVSDDASCWTTNELGVFVSSEHGDDDKGDGTRESPFATIMKGVASAAGKNIYVCLGATKDTYAERISVDATTDGTRIYGGFDCETWNYSTTRSSAVASPDNIALRIASVKKGVYIENVRFTAADAKGTDLDASSYGAFVTDSKNVSLTRVELTAGAGFKGAGGMDADPGDDGTPVPGDAKAPEKGKGADCSSPPATQAGGAWAAQSACLSLGGQGGTGRADAGLNGGTGDPGAPSTNVSEPSQDNSGPGATAVGVKGGRGGDGSNGLQGDVGLAAPSAGVFSVAGFALANGKTGKQGHPGQGGGGGGASKGNGTCVGASGGAGGMGGCGGLPGKAGGGGGASVGLLSWDSDVTLTFSKLTSAAGGAGGVGGAGGLRGQGSPGATGGLGTGAVNDGGTGGDGGDGGDGGSGSGGTGGPSIALVYSGTKPSYDLVDTTLAVASGGDAGIGGQVLTTKAPDGSSGDAAAVFEVK